METTTAIFQNLMLPDLKLMLVEKDDQAMKEFCEELHPAVIAEVIEYLEPADAWIVLSHSLVERRAELFEYLPLSMQVSLVDIMGKQNLTTLIEHMSSDDRVDLLNQLDDDHVESLLPLIAQAERKDIKNLLSYPEDSAGSIMTTDYSSLPSNITVGTALEKLRLQAPDKETIYYIYIVNQERRLQGVVSLKNLILTKQSTPLTEIIERQVITIQVEDDVEDVAQKFDRYGFIAMPVVDQEGRLVGIITHDDAMDVLGDAATEDAHMQAAIVPLQESYLESTFLDLAYRRGKWLVILLGASLLTSGLMNWIVNYLLEDSSASGWLMMFIPMVMATGGNAGSQSATLIIRALAVEQLDNKDIFHILKREILLGAFLGIIMGLLAFLAAYMFLFNITYASVVGTTVLLVVMLGTFTGTGLPVLLNRFGADPALMSNPLISVLIDACGVITYFTIARILVGQLTTG